MSHLLLFSSPDCPGCKTIKAFLAKHGKAYQEFDTSTPDGLTEFRLTVPGELQLPVLVIRDQDHDVIFRSKDLLDRFEIRPGPWQEAIGIKQ